MKRWIRKNGVYVLSAVVIATLIAIGLSFTLTKEVEAMTKKKVAAYHQVSATWTKDENSGKVSVESEATVELVKGKVTRIDELPNYNYWFISKDEPISAQEENVKCYAIYLSDGDSEVIVVDDHNMYDNIKVNDTIDVIINKVYGMNNELLDITYHINK